MFRKPFVLVLALAGALASCDSPSGSRPAGPPARLDIVAGDLQTGTVGTQLAAPLVVKVTDDNGKAVSGQVVNFRVTGGNGTVFAGAAITDKNGQASERWTLGTTARDTQKVEARAVETSTGATLVFGTFRAIGTPDAPAALSRLAGDAQTAPLGSPLADSLAVKVADKYGNGIAGQTVTFAESGGGTVAPATSTTDALGIARAQWKLGARLDTAQAATASSGALAPVSFAATATIAGTLSKAAGDAQTAQVAHLLADSLAVRLTLADGSPVKGATILWSAQAGSPLPATSVTDATGTARAAWLLGISAGAQAVTAKVAGGSQQVSFSATGTAGPAERMNYSAGDVQAGTIAMPLPNPLVVRLWDHYSNPVAGAAVTWTVTKGGGSVSPAVSTSDSNGAASTRWTLGARYGEGQFVTATSGAIEPVTFSAIPVTVVGTLTVTGGSGQTGPAGGTLPDSLEVTLTTFAGQPIVGANVGWATSSGHVAPAISRTDEAGRAHAAWTVGTTPGSATATATAGGQTVPLTATVTAASPDRLKADAGSSQAARPSPGRPRTAAPARPRQR